MKARLLSLLLMFAAVAGMQAKVVTYTADNTTIFTNPERGFTNEYSRKVKESRPNILKGDDSWHGSKWTLAVVLYNLYYFKNKELPSEVLNGFDEDMQELRNNGYKCVLRFAYTETESDIVDATPDWVEKHIKQLSPYLKKNSDVIYVLEAGFVGVWGEWYYTKNYGNESQHMNTNRRRVVDALLANTPEDMFVLFRYPMLKHEYLGDSNPLTAEEAFTGTYRARMGHHNDAFLNTYGDMGTYASDDKNDDPKMRQFIADETFYLPNGGESNIEESNVAAQRATYDKTMDALGKYHWSFCGLAYPPATIQKWRNDGTLDEMYRRLGYRYQLRESDITDNVAPAGKCNVTISICNVGCAPLYHERHAYLVLKNSSKTYSIQLQSDPRRWLPNGVVSVINEKVDIPADIPAGTYNLYLYMPDRHEELASNPRYAIRFANEDVWSETTGMNDLKTTVTVSSDAPKDPGDLPEIPGTALDDITFDTTDAEWYDLLGRRVSTDYQGIIISNGKKYMVVR